MFEEDSTDKVLKFVGIFIGVVIGAWVIAYVVRSAQNSADMKQFSEVMTTINGEIHAQQQAAMTRRAANEARATQLRAEAKGAELDRQRALAAERRARDAKERAWREHFRVSAQCENPGDDWNAQVACSNEYMRARAEWERSYVP